MSYFRSGGDAIAGSAQDTGQTTAATVLGRILVASWQAHLAVWIVRWRVKRKLRGLRDCAKARKVLRPEPYVVPKQVRVSPATVAGVPGEWVERMPTPHETSAEPVEGAKAARGASDGAGATDHVLLYLHGGGYFGCSAETHRPITVGFALQGFRVFAPDYRLAPEHPFPAAVDDAVAVYRGLLDEGCSHEQLAIAGDSAGGGLTLALMLALREANVPSPAAAAVFSPWTDLAGTGESLHKNERNCAMFCGSDVVHTARWYLGSADPRNPLASPLYGDLTGLPPLLVHVGADEVLLDDSTRLADRARAAGARVELKIWLVVPHAWQLAPNKIPEGRQSLREAAAFLRQVIDANSKGT